MNRRYMINPQTERRIANGALWLVLACVIVAILTSCSPYAASQGNTRVTLPTPSATATATPAGEPFQIREWWMYSTLTATPTPRPMDGRRNYK